MRLFGYATLMQHRCTYLVEFSPTFYTYKFVGLKFGNTLDLGAVLWKYYCSFYVLKNQKRHCFSEIADFSLLAFGFQKPADWVDWWMGISYFLEVVKIFGVKKIKANASKQSRVKKSLSKALATYPPSAEKWQCNAVLIGGNDKQGRIHLQLPNPPEISKASDKQNHFFPLLGFLVEKIGTRKRPASGFSQEVNFWQN